MSVFGIYRLVVPLLNKRDSQVQKRNVAYQEGLKISQTAVRVKVVYIQLYER